MFDLTMSDEEKNTFIAALALGYMRGITDINEAVAFTKRVMEKNIKGFEDVGEERAAVLGLAFVKFKELGQ